MQFVDNMLVFSFEDLFTILKKGGYLSRYETLEEFKKSEDLSTFFRGKTRLDNKDSSIFASDFIGYINHVAIKESKNAKI